MPAELFWSDFRSAVSVLTPVPGLIIPPDDAEPIPKEAFMAEFPVNPIMSLVGKAPRHDLGGSYGPNLFVREVLGAGAPLEDLPFSYRSAEGDPRLRNSIAEL